MAMWSIRVKDAHIKLGIELIICENFMPWASHTIYDKFSKNNASTNFSAHPIGHFLEVLVFALSMHYLNPRYLPREAISRYELV